MKATGLIVEYNPFHNGHQFHIGKSLLDTNRRHTVAVMSGNFVQRGEPAVCDKWRRTRMALEQGIDIVIELPLIYASGGTEHFSYAAVSLLNATGIVDRLCFGSESGDIKIIRQTARILSNEPPVYKEQLKTHLRRGVSFPTARGLALAACLSAYAVMREGDAALFLSEPNNNLGIEYCKALYDISSHIEPFTIRRESNNPSAAAVRKALRAGRLDEVSGNLPASVYKSVTEALRMGETARLDNLSALFQYRLRTASEGELTASADMTEDLAKRFRNLALKYPVLSDALTAVKTKRYTYTRLQRAALHLILGVTRQMYQQSRKPPYIRVLGFRKKSEALLSALCKQASLPVITNLKHARAILSDQAMTMLEKEIEATDLYALATDNAQPARFDSLDTPALPSPGTHSLQKKIHGIHHEYNMQLVII